METVETVIATIILIVLTILAVDAIGNKSIQNLNRVFKHESNAI